MIATTIASIQRLGSGVIGDQQVMAWTCPVPYFGQLREARVATLGINPSSREFVDASGQELDGARRRFPTLRSLGLSRWSDASDSDVTAIVSACDGYFVGNPYNRWFRVLDAVISTTGSSYYSTDMPAAHLDLVPYATHTKWGDLRPDQRRLLLDSDRDLVGALLRDSPVQLLVLNGRSVVREFEKVCGLQLEKEGHSSWDLTRRRSPPVPGIGYVGTVERIGGVNLDRLVSIVGFNHNLQSSFGVTRCALSAITDWLGTRMDT